MDTEQEKREAIRQAYFYSFSILLISGIVILLIGEEKEHFIAILMAIIGGVIVVPILISQILKYSRNKDLRS